MKSLISVVPCVFLYAVIGHPLYTLHDVITLTIFFFSFWFIYRTRDDRSAQGNKGRHRTWVSYNKCSGAAKEGRGETRTTGTLWETKRRWWRTQEEGKAIWTFGRLQWHGIQLRVAIPSRKAVANRDPDTVVPSPTQSRPGASPAGLQRWPGQSHWALPQRRWVRKEQRQRLLAVGPRALFGERPERDVSYPVWTTHDSRTGFFDFPYPNAHWQARRRWHEVGLYPSPTCQLSASPSSFLAQTTKSFPSRRPLGSDLNLRTFQSEWPSCWCSRAWQVRVPSYASAQSLWKVGCSGQWGVSSICLCALPDMSTRLHAVSEPPQHQSSGRKHR